MRSTHLASRLFLVLGLGTLAAGLGGACSAAGNNSSRFSGSGDSGSTESGNGGGNSGSGSANGGTSGVGNFVGSSASGTGAGSGAGGSCAASPYQAMQLPLDMYIIQDQSGSMSDEVSEGGTKWQAVTTALNAFVAQPGVAGISVGIQYFGVPPSGSANCNCTTDSDCTMPGDFCDVGICFECSLDSTDSCTAADYAHPEVEIAPLPGVASAITASLAKHSPSTGTPTGPALQGAVDHAKAWAMSHTGHVVIAVLATDGEPNECSPDDQTGIAQIAATALAGTPSVKTFTIGTFAAGDMPSGPDLLNAIAAAGGTGTAFNIDTTTNVNQAFLAALNKIRGTALGCQYNIPVPTSGTPDYNKVNVQYTPGTGAPETFPKVADKAACPSLGNGWYYDNNSAPTQIELCNASCTTVSADSKGKIEILLGCTSVTAT
jgi:hypothetical protein